MQPFEKLRVEMCIISIHALVASSASAIALSPAPAAPALAHSSFRRVAFSDDVDMLVSSRCTHWREMLGVVQKGDDLAERVVRHVSKPDFPWTTDRHKLYPTTDCEVHSMPWLEDEMATLLRKKLFPAIASLYRVDERCLFLRDQFIVKYSSAAGAQRGLESHVDESCFSFVMQLNDPSCFAGGGTLFEHADAALSVAQGDTILFCGYTRHAGVPLITGTRYILAGFVDYRADVVSQRAESSPGAVCEGAH